MTGTFTFAVPPGLEATAPPEERGLRRDGVRLMVALAEAPGVALLVAVSVTV